MTWPLIWLGLAALIASKGHAVAGAVVLAVGWAMEAVLGDRAYQRRWYGE